ncbi:MAG: V-type ATP synthase subunit D [Lachnospiraceae bacterium]|jgi:V/A-type H+-transporting ATPase subunit D|nr:V-type ATP synthase subunit D [Lachnospiraceae bacterium]
MDPNEVPTKGNLMRARNSLKLARQGYDLMDKKRNILIRELTAYTEEAREIQEVINETYRKAYASLQKANMQMGIENVQTIAETLPVDMSIEVKTRSVMGTEIPLVRYDAEQNLRPAYAFFRTRDSLDEARAAFARVKDLTVRLAQVETAAYRLAANIQKTQKRANALKNITIPHYEELAKTIGAALEEKEREEFTRLKVIKKQKQRKQKAGSA